MKDDPGLNELGGASYLAKLAASAVAGFAVQNYAQLIYDLAIRRQLILLGKISVSELKMEIDQEPREHWMQSKHSINWEKLEQTVDLNRFKAVTDAVDIANATFNETEDLQEFQLASLI